jgi:hypothetical protein
MTPKKATEINKNYLLLRLFGFEFEPDKMTEFLSLTPEITGKKGEDYYVGPSKSLKRVWEYNHWEYEFKKITSEYIGVVISSFFDEIIKPRLGILKKISKKCPTIRLVVVQYYYDDCNPGYNLTKEQIKILAEIKGEIELDIYCLNENAE